MGVICQGIALTMDKKPAYGIKDVEILDNEPCYSGFLSVDLYRIRHRLFGGGWSGVFSREVLRRLPGVGVLLYDPDLDKVLMVEQFRAGCLDNPGGPWVLELVAGVVERGESPQAVAVREAREEAGARIDRLIPVCEYYNSPGGSSERITIYCARVDAGGAAGVYGLKDEHEDIRTVVLKRREAEEAVQAGRINNAMAIIAIQWLRLNLHEVMRSFATNETALQHKPE